jgi:pimeloyl-ACP methyl ester carboxylesterase
MKLIILPGWGHNKNFWTEFKSHFSEGRVIVFDLPGFGEEPLAGEDWGIPQYAAWVIKKVEKFDKNDSNIVLLGHSFGGRIASFIASQNPTWLKGLILYGAPLLYRPTLSLQFKIITAKMLKKIGFSRPVSNKELQEADNKGMGEIFRKAVVFDQTELLEKINVPTLMLWGKDDRDVPLRMAYEAQRLIPKNKLVIMDNVGHNAHLENGNLFYGTVKNFIENL